MCFRKAAAYAVIVLFVGALWSVTAFSQGVIVPRPCERCPRPIPPPGNLPRALPVRSVKIETRITSQVATTHIEQVFRNDNDATLEGTYFFPIPESASITEFAIWDGNRRLVGEVRSREEARRIYDEIVRRQRDPGLLEYAGKDLFQASIFPIPGHSDKKLELTYSQVLKAESGVVGYKYPLGTGRNFAQIGSVSGRVEIEGKEGLRNIYSPSHAIDVAKSSDRRAAVSFETKNSAPQQDFQLYYGVSNEDFGISLLTHREPGRDGYFLLMISPKDQLTEQQYSAKDIVFVVDTSGSMSDEGKMEKARAALRFGVRGLNREDRFNIISFAGEDHLMTLGLVMADDTGKARGEVFVRQLRPTGGTNINEALVSSERLFDRADRPKMIVFITDGLPTVGETNVDRIVENVRSSRSTGVRLFTFGVGYDVNTALLDKLAAENGGVAAYVEPREDLEQKVSTFFEKISFPVLTDIRLELGGADTDLIYPRNMQDIFKGSQMTIIGRYRNPVDLDPVRIRLAGKSGSEQKSMLYDGLRFPLVEDNNDFLPKLWATRRVGWLIEQIRTNGEQKELRDEVVDLGTRYGIVTPYTSYLALEPNAVDEPDRRAVMGGMPSPVQGNMTARMKAAPRPSVNATTGAGAVRQSKELRTMDELVRVEDDKLAHDVRRSGGKTFYLTEGVWVDSDFKAESKLPETVLKFASDEYFDLLKKRPKLADYFSLGERVVVLFEGRVFRVNSASR